MQFLDYLWLIPVLPLLGAALNALLGPRAPKWLTTSVALLAPGSSLAISLGALWEFAQYPEPVRNLLYQWTAGELTIDIAFMLDSLSSVMLFVVTFVGFLIHVYSVGYMAHERGYQRYFVYLNLFMSMMLLLILGSNFLVTFVGWEGVGLCSYLLIGFYYDQKFPPEAGRKAFVVNRIGDFAFLMAIFAIFTQFGTLEYREIVASVVADPQSFNHGTYLIGLSFAGFVSLCVFAAATGKSAQIPLFVWLPDAMAGPTPVSALIHAATMVTAGLYMLARVNVFFRLSPGIMTLVAVVAAVTALMAATIGVVQRDIKKVLAYSTVSQLGYMFLAAGSGAFVASIFHLGTHAFFKALLFLGSGSVIHAMSGEQDIRSMGGLKKHLPHTRWTFLIGTLAIAGFPPLAGFFSKDAILAAAWENHKILFAMGLFTAALTAFYMFRLYFLTFHGKFRGSEEQLSHLHESPASMTIPLWILALGSIGAGWVGTIPFLHKDWLSAWMSDLLPSLGHDTHQAHHGGTLEMLLVGGSIAAALFGFILAYRLYGGDKGLAEGEKWAASWPRIHRLVLEKYRIDELYAKVVVGPLRMFAQACWKIIDVILIDGAIHVGAFIVELTGDLGRFSTTGNVRNYAFYFFGGVLVLFCWVLF